MKLDIGGHIITAKPEITDEARDILGQLPPVKARGTEPVQLRGRAPLLRRETCRRSWTYARKRRSTASVVCARLATWRS
jgi:hypothetical protein